MDSYLRLVFIFELTFLDFRYVLIQKEKKGILGKLMKRYVKMFGVSGFFANQDGIGVVHESGYISGGFEKFDTPTSVEWLSGCNMSYRMDAIDNVGIFDSTYVKYFDDADFGYRVFDKGYNLVALPQAILNHNLSSISRDSLGTVKYQQLLDCHHFFMKNIYKKNNIRYIKHQIANFSLFFPVLFYSIVYRNFGLLKGYLKAMSKVVK
jgi:GT2 family glycosyltransferase